MTIPVPGHITPKIGGVEVSIEDTWGNFFKSDVRTSGSRLFAQQKVSISSGSDTGIHAYVKVAPPSRVRLSSTDIDSESFTADCSCPAAKKGRLCKHVWATLLCVEQTHPDFLSSKQVIEKAEAAASGQDEFAAAAKLRAANYRREQYQRAKERAKQRKRGGRDPEPPGNLSTLPPQVEAACAYFADNGFPMVPGPSEEVVGEAKKKLSRVFHPDKGGSHAEIVELNRHSEVIMAFLRA